MILGIHYPGDRGDVKPGWHTGVSVPSNSEVS